MVCWIINKQQKKKTRLIDVWVEFVMKLQWLLIRMTCGNSYKSKRKSVGEIISTVI